MGKLIVSKYRNDIAVPMLSEQEIEMLAVESGLRMKTRKDFESKLGKPIYSFTLYEKIKRATILYRTRTTMKGIILFSWYHLISMQIMTL